ncbi:MAG: hypothetical protein ABFR19_07615 [Pseudomonadota bacterium]
MSCVQAHVTAIVARRKQDTPPEYLQQLRCDNWEVVLPELVFL